MELGRPSARLLRKVGASPSRFLEEESNRSSRASIVPEAWQSGAAAAAGLRAEAEMGALSKACFYTAFTGVKSAE